MIPAQTRSANLRSGLSTGLSVWWLANFPLLSFGSYAGFTYAKWLFLLGGAGLSAAAASASPIV